MISHCLYDSSLCLCDQHMHCGALDIYILKTWGPGAHCGTLKCHPHYHWISPIRLDLTQFESPLIRTHYSSPMEKFRSLIRTGCIFSHFLPVFSEILKNFACGVHFFLPIESQIKILTNKKWLKKKLIREYTLFKDLVYIFSLIILNYCTASNITAVVLYISGGQKWGFYSRGPYSRGGGGLFEYIQ